MSNWVIAKNKTRTGRRRTISFAFLCFFCIRSHAFNAVYRPLLLHRQDHFSAYVWAVCVRGARKQETFFVAARVARQQRHAGRLDLFVSAWFAAAAADRTTTSICAASAFSTSGIPSMVRA